MAEATITKFSQACIEGISKQVAMEMEAFYAYQALHIHFSQHTIALPNTAKIFKKMRDEELDHADKLIAYAQLHGGQVTLTDIKAPQKKGVSLLQAFEAALNYEKGVYANLLKLRELADKESEFHFAAFLEEEFLTEQITAEDELMRFIATIKRMGTGLGEQLFDQQLES